MRWADAMRVPDYIAFAILFVLMMWILPELDGAHCRNDQESGYGGAAGSCGSSVLTGPLRDFLGVNFALGQIA